MTRWRVAPVSVLVVGVALVGCAPASRHLDDLFSSRGEISMGGTWVGVRLNPTVDSNLARERMIAYIEGGEGCLRLEVEGPVDQSPLRAWPEAPDYATHYERRIDGRERVAMMLSALTGVPLWFSHYETRLERQAKIRAFLVAAREAPVHRSGP